MVKFPCGGIIHQSTTISLFPVNEWQLSIITISPVIKYYNVPAKIVHIYALQYFYLKEKSDPSKSSQTSR